MKMYYSSEIVHVFSCLEYHYSHSPDCKEPLKTVTMSWYSHDTYNLIVSFIKLYEIILMKDREAYLYIL